MDAINTNHGPSQADLLVQQSAQQAAPPPQPAAEERGETVEQPTELATEGNVGRHINTYA